MKKKILLVSVEEVINKFKLGESPEQDQIAAEMLGI